MKKIPQKLKNRVSIYKIIGTVLLVFHFGTNSVFAQFDHSAQGARSAALGGSFIALSDLWSNVDNLAGAAFSSASHAEIGISYSRPHWLDLSHQNVAATIHAGKGAVIANLSNWGNADYQESKITAGYAIRVMSGLSIGIGGHLLTTNINDNYYTPQPPVLTMSAGIQYRSDDQFCIGARIFNPGFSSLRTESDTKIPVVMNVGCVYRLTETLSATVEIEKNIYLHHTTRLGIEYVYRKQFSARMGFSTYPSTWSFGLGYIWQSFNIDMSAVLHTYLGLTPQLSASYRF